MVGAAVGRDIVYDNDLIVLGIIKYQGPQA
jgi:hypothetical protein